MLHTGLYCILMNTFTECIPCLQQQTAECLRMATDDEDLRKHVMQAVMAILDEHDPQQPPPAVAGKMHRMIRHMTGCRDPYRAVKKRFNHWAAGIYPQLRGLVDAATDPLDAAVRIAIAGNLIDFGVNEEEIRKVMAQLKKLDESYPGGLRSYILQAKKLLKGTFMSSFFSFMRNLH